MISQKPIELVLFFTRGVSLRTWEEAGILARESALYQQLLDRNIAVTFVTYGDRSEKQFVTQTSGIRILTNNWNLPRDWYQKKLAMFPPRGEVFKSNQLDGAEVALAAARSAGAKFIARCGYLLSEFQAQQYGIGSAAAQQASHLEQDVFMKADLITVSTAAISDVVQDRYLIPEAKIRVVPNYVEIERFRPEAAAAKGKIRIGFVGRLSPQKNLPALIDAMSGLDAELVLVGVGMQKEQLAVQAAAKRVEVSFLGRVANMDLPKVLNSFDVFILPSLYEGHPKALLEAMACGLPVIGTRVPGTQELIVDAENGILCEPDAASIHQALERALGDSALRKRLGQNARQTVKKQFSLERIVDLEMAILSDLVS